MSIRAIQPRRARIAVVGLAAAALSFVALPGSVQAQSYPPGPGPDQGEQIPPLPPEQAPSGEVSSGGATITSGELPATGGSDTTQILWIASSALLAGVAISGVSLRRRNVASTDAI
jgi:LPXTG-motif cell wall-anchored protein